MSDEKQNELGESDDTSNAAYSNTVNEPVKAKQPRKKFKAKPDKENTTQDLIRRIESTGLDLFHDQREFPYARIPVAGGRKIIPIRSEEFTKWLSGFAWRTMKWAPARETLYSARRVLESKAAFDGPQITLHLRVAWHEGAIWVDLDGLKAVWISKEGWKVDDDPPILFRSYPHQKPLPVPIGGGSVEDTSKYINLADIRDRNLLLTWFIGAFVPDISVPILILYGPAHSGKSTIFEITRKLIDPCIPKFQGKLSTVRDFSQLASQFRLIIFDNEGKVTDAQADTLCGAITGNGDTKRVLYTDEDTIVREYQNVACINGVRLAVEQTDLLSRSILYELEQLPHDGLFNETDLWDEFNEASPAILGGIFDTLSAAMTVVDKVELKWSSRLTDFTRWAAAIAHVQGWDANQVIKTYKRNVNRQHEAVLESDSVAQAVVKFHSECDYWKGSATELKEILTRIAERNGIDTHYKTWPSTPQYLSERLNYLTSCLEYAGISVQRARKGDQRTITITSLHGSEHKSGDINLSDDGNINSDDVLVSFAVTPEQASTQLNDDDDANDDDFTGLSKEV